LKLNWILVRNSKIHNYDIKQESPAVADKPARRGVMQL